MKTSLVGALAASMLVAVVVTAASLLQPPTYEASAKVVVNLHSTKCSRQVCLIPLAPSASLTQLAREAVRIDGPSVAKEAIRRPGLEVSTDELLDGLRVRQFEPFIRLSYRDTDPERAKEVVGTVGRVAAERITGTSTEKMPLDTELTATVWEPATLPDAPASPKLLRNGLIALVVALVFCAGTALARTAVGTRVAGTLGERPSRQGVGQAGVLGRRHRDYSIVERIKEKKLLRALGRRGKLTAVEAALETSLSVEEADRILSELAARGHLKVTVEHGKLLYSFWAHDAP